jgi:hypothetical protein
MKPEKRPLNQPARPTLHGRRPRVPKVCLLEVLAIDWRLVFGVWLEREQVIAFEFLLVHLEFWFIWISRGQSY